MTEEQLAVKIRHQVAIAGQVIDQHTGQGIALALVEITAGPPGFEGSPFPHQARTDSAGYFHFINLPDTTEGHPYQLEATLPGAGSRYGRSQPITAEVRRDPNDSDTIIVRQIDLLLALPPTTLEGNITIRIGNGASDSLALAQVRLHDSGERSFSDGDGHYRLGAIEASETCPRTVIVSASRHPGYSATANQLLYPAGVTETLDLELTKANTT